MKMNYNVYIMKNNVWKFNLEPMLALQIVLQIFHQETMVHIHFKLDKNISSRNNGLDKFQIGQKTCIIWYPYSKVKGCLSVCLCV